MYDVLMELIGYPETRTVFYPYDYICTLLLTLILLLLIVRIILSIFRG